MDVNLLILIAIFGVRFSAKAEVLNLENESEIIYDKALIQQLITTVNEIKERDTQTQILIKKLEIKVDNYAKEILELKLLRKQEHEHNNDELANTDDKHPSTSTNMDTIPNTEEKIHVQGIRLAVNAKTSFHRRASLGQGVAFFATLSTTVEHLGQGQNVKFGNVVTNIGNGYNPNLGVFIAPVAGTYVFSTTITTYKTHSAHYGFFRQGVLLTTIYVNGHENSYDSTSETIVLELAMGNDVEVRCVNVDHAVNGENHSMFSGFLVVGDASDVAIVG